MLAKLADDRCKRSKVDIALSLEGTWKEDHLFEFKQAYDLYKYLQTQMAECDHKIEGLLMSYAAAVNIDTDSAAFVRSRKRKNRKNEVGFDVEMYNIT